MKRSYDYRHQWIQNVLIQELISNQSRKKKIKTEPIDILFEVFNANGTKNEKVTRFALLEVEINRHMEKINSVVINLNRINMFLGYDWLVKHNPKINWKIGTI